MTTEVFDEVLPPPTMTPAEIQRLIPEDEVNLLMELGNRRDQDRWLIGDLMYQKVDGLGWPVRQTGQVYADLTKYRDDRRVREFYYCFKFYQERPGTMAMYRPVLDWDVMNLARKCPNPDQVLADALHEGYTYAELAEMYRERSDDPEPAYAPAKVPAAFRPLFRWLRNRIKPEKWAEAETLIDAFMAHMRELANE